MATFTHPFDIPQLILDRYVYSGFDILRNGRSLDMHFTRLVDAMDYASILADNICSEWNRGETRQLTYTDCRFVGRVRDIQYDVVAIDSIHDEPLESIRIVDR